MSLQYDFMGDLESTNDLPKNPDIGHTYRIDNYYYVWEDSGWAVYDPEDYKYQDSINFIGKIASTDLLPKSPLLGDTYEIDTFFYSWNNKEWVINYNEKSNLRAINVMQSETVVGPAGPAGDVWIPAVDSFGNISWTRNTGVTPPSLVNIMGEKGDSGARGPQGSAGPTGPQGQMGISGPEGKQGPQGLTGAQGVSGSAGPQGLTGQRGPKGDKGDLGDTGGRGLIGQQGPRGYGIDVKMVGTNIQFKKENEQWGENSEYGNPVDISGPIGPEGPSGPIGLPGPKGPRGYTGNKGSIGGQGIQGPSGSKGEKGETGAGVKIVGEVQSTSELPYSATIGDAFMCKDSVYVWVDNTKSWKQIENIRGPKGEQGEVGETIQMYLGEVKTVESFNQAAAELVWQGKDRILNISLPKGEEGPVGPSNVISASVETTLPTDKAEVLVTGQSPNQNMHFRIPAGKAGAQGVTGASGKDIEYRWVNSDGNPDEVNGRFLQTRIQGGTWSSPKELGGKDGKDGVVGEKGEIGDVVDLGVSIEQVDDQTPPSVSITEIKDGYQNIHFKIPKAKDGKDGKQGEKGVQGPIGPAGPPGMIDYGLVYMKQEVDDMLEDLDTSQNPIFKTGISIDTNGESGLSLFGSKTIGAPYEGIIHSQTSKYGKHGKTNGIMATYSLTNGIENGWIWNANGKNIGSLSQHGDLVVNGSIESGDITSSGIIKGSFFGDLEGNVIGNSTSSDKLSTPIIVSLEGGVTGQSSFDGSENFVIQTELSGNIGLVDNTNKVTYPSEMLDGMYGSVETTQMAEMPGVGLNSFALNLNSKDIQVPNTQLGFSKGSIAFRQENDKFNGETKHDSELLFAIQSSLVNKKYKLTCYSEDNIFPVGWENLKYIEDHKNNVIVFYDVAPSKYSKNNISGAIDSNGQVYVGEGYKIQFPDLKMCEATTSTIYSSDDEYGKKVHTLSLNSGKYTKVEKVETVFESVQQGSSVSLVCEYEYLTNMVPNNETIIFSIENSEQGQMQKILPGVSGKIEFENVKALNGFSVKLITESLILTEPQKIKLKIYYVEGASNKPFTTLEVPNGAMSISADWSKHKNTFILKNAKRKLSGISSSVYFSKLKNSECSHSIIPAGSTKYSLGISSSDVYFEGTQGGFPGELTDGFINFAISVDDLNNKFDESPEYLPEKILIYKSNLSTSLMGIEISKDSDIKNHHLESVWNDWGRLYTDTYHPQADKITTHRKFSFEGDVVGEFSTDMSKNSSINLNVVNDSHFHNSTYYTKEEIEKITEKSFTNHGLADNLDETYKNGVYSVEKYGALTSPWVGESEGRIFNITKDGMEFDPSDTSNKNSISQIFVNSDGRIATRDKKGQSEWGGWTYTYGDLNHPLADKLTFARKINSVPFDGTEDITITADPNAHTHDTSDLISGILDISRGGTGIDGNLLEGFIKRDKFSDSFKSVKNISWHDIIDIPPSLGGNGSGGSGGSGNITVPNASTTTAGIVMLSIDPLDSSISKAATPYLTNQLGVKISKNAEDLLTHMSEYKVHTHDFDRIKIVESRDIAESHKLGLVKMYNSQNQLYDEEKGVPTLKLLNDEAKMIYENIDAVVEIITELDERKTDLGHKHNISTDISDGVLSVKFGGTGAISYSGKYIISSNSDYLSSCDKIPWADIEIDGDAFANKVHMHSWLEIYEDSIPKAEDDSLIHGVVKMTNDWNSSANDETMSAYAIQKKVESFSSDSAPKDHNHDDRYRRLDSKLAWQDINKFTVDKACIGDGEQYQGIVSLSDSLSLDRSDIAATASAIKKLNDRMASSGQDFAPLFHNHDASHITSGILDIDRGGTGLNLRSISGGFLKFNSTLSKIESNMYVASEDLDTSVINMFAKSTHKHSFWDDLNNIPISSANENTIGLAKISTDKDYDGTDIDNVAAHISLIKMLGDQIENFEIDAYTKIQSDAKFLGKQNLPLINFDDITKLSIVENNDMIELEGQINSPSKSYGLLQTLPSDRINAQMYYDIDGKLFFRSYARGAQNHSWKQLMMGGEIDIATYEKAGVFRVESDVLRDENFTVPTTKLVFDSTEDLKEYVFDNFAQTRHRNFGHEIDGAVQRAIRFDIPEQVRFIGDITTDPFFIYGGSIMEVPLTIAKISSLTESGIVQLSQDFTEKSELKAATIGSVSDIYDMLTGDSDEVVYVKKSGDIMSGELSLPSIVLNASDLSHITNGPTSLTLNSGNGQINGANIYHENNRPTPSDIGAEPHFSILPIAKGGTGAAIFSNKYVINDGSPFLKSINNLPWVDIVNVPISSTTQAGIIKIGQLSTDASAGNHRHLNATSASDGFMQMSDKSKIDGIQSGAEVNQTAFGVIKADSSQITSSQKIDTIQLISGSNISLKAEGKSITIDNVYSHPVGDGNLHVPQNGTTNGGKFLMSSSASGVYNWTSLPDASTSLKGIVKLNNSLTSRSQIEAPTANALSTLYDMLTSDDPNVAYVKKSGDTMIGQLTLPNLALSRFGSSIINASGATIVDSLSNATKFGATNSKTILNSSQNPSISILGVESEIFHVGRNPDINSETSGVLLVSKGGTGTNSFSEKYVVSAGGSGLSSIAKIPWGDVDVEFDEDGNIVPPGGGDGNGGFLPAEHTHPWSDIRPETIPRAASSLGTEGIVALENSTSSISITKAATPNSVNSVNLNANSRVSKAGDIMTGNLTAPSLIATGKVEGKVFEFGPARIVFNTTDQSIDFIID